MLERALNTGLCNWQGLVRNIEYLGMDDSIKRVIGKWWRRWIKTDVGRRGSEPGADASCTKANPGSKGKNGDNVDMNGAKARAEGLGSDEDVEDEDEDDGLDDREEVDQAEYGHDREDPSQRDRQAGLEGGARRVWQRENGSREGARDWNRERELERELERRLGQSGHRRADGDGMGGPDAAGDQAGVGDEMTEMDTDMESGDGPGPPNDHAVTEERLRSLMGAL